MPATVTCPQCSAVCQLPDNAMGKTLCCARCRHTFLAGAEPLLAEAITAGKPVERRPVPAGGAKDVPGPRTGPTSSGAGGGSLVVGLVALVLIGFCLIGVGILGTGGWMMFRAGHAAGAAAKVPDPAPVAAKPADVPAMPAPPPVKVVPPDVPAPPPVEEKPAAPPVEKKPVPPPEKKLDLPKLASTTPNVALPRETQQLVGGARATVVTVKGAADLVGDVVWHRDGKAVFLLDAHGVLRRVRLDGWVEDRRLDLGRRAGNLALSGMGLLVALTDAQEIWVIDPETLTVTARREAPGLRRVVSAPTLKQAVAATGENNVFGSSELRLIDLQWREPTRTFKLPVKFLVMASTGKHLFAQGEFGQIQRYRLEGNDIVTEDATPCIGQNQNSQRINISPDGKYVCLPSGGGNSQDVPNHPPIGPYTTYVYATDDLRRPAFTVPSGAYPRVVGFDPVGGHVFAQNHGTSLLLFSTTGLKKKEFKTLQVPGDRDEVLEFAAHPGGNKVLVRFPRHVALVDLVPADGANLPKAAEPISLKNALKSLELAEGRKVIGTPVIIDQVYFARGGADSKRDGLVMMLYSGEAEQHFGPNEDAEGKLLTESGLNFIIPRELNGKLNVYRSKLGGKLCHARLTFTIEHLAERFWVARISRLEMLGKGDTVVQTIE